MTTHSPQTGATVLIDSLLANGATMAFGVPGESYLAALDALHDRRAGLPFFTCRHEAAATNMAEAFGKLTGRPGITFVTRGPGATHATTGLHTAYQDSTPMLLLIGQVARHMRDREAFQELDYARFLGEVTKWAGEIADPDRMAEYVGRAFATATAGRQGPTALALPEDVLAAPAAVQENLPHAPAQATASAADVARAAELLSAAERPLLIIGGTPWREEEAAALQQFAERRGLPIAVSFRAQSLIDNDSPAYAGHLGLGTNPALLERLRQADLVLAIGPRLGEVTTAGYTRLKAPVPEQRLVHVHAGAEELGRVYCGELLINAAPGAFAAALASEDPSGAWAETGAAAHAAEEEWRKPVVNAGSVQIAQVIDQLRSALPPEAVVANGAGNYAAWLHRFFSYRGFKTQLAPTSGAMGYGVPAGIAAALLERDRPTVALAGDGCFLMSGSELATAARYNARVVFLVVNNAMYGTIRMHQERSYPGRVLGTDLTNPDFVAYAKSFGLPAWKVEHTDDFSPALARALAIEGPSLIELVVDPEAISPGASLSDLGAGRR